MESRREAKELHRAKDFNGTHTTMANHHHLSREKPEI